MKESPRMQSLDAMLRSSRLVAGGFMGGDTRSADEIINEDSARIAQLAVTAGQIASRMGQITDKAKGGLGTWVRIDDKLKAVVHEAKGTLTCPWPHPGEFDKRVTTVERLDSADSIRWSDLNIHMIAEHGFFEGKGSPFRIEPAKIIRIILK
ncbi:MAG TPA: hypothetical protein VMW16_15645 [Sedimentisphaerales bacterium]|nr:hypothetical protein [Sedimentisphaerales bacterium]